MTSKCPSCSENSHIFESHNFESEEFLYCVPPPKTLKFGNYVLSQEYKKALFDEYPFYTAEEVVGSFLGHNPYFPSQDEWEEEREAEENEAEENESNEVGMDPSGNGPVSV